MKRGSPGVVVCAGAVIVLTALSFGVLPATSRVPPRPTNGVLSDTRLRLIRWFEQLRLPDLVALVSAQEEGDAVFQRLLGGLPKDGQRATSARLELEYWNQAGFGGLRRHRVKSKTGQVMEVIFLKVPAISMPGTDFSMAFLVKV